jgi:hypothetical protein
MTANAAYRVFGLQEESLSRVFIWFWVIVPVAYYLPLLIPGHAVIEPDDLLNSELVYSRAIGALWRGDSSIADAFLAGSLPHAALSRLTQPLMILYAALPPLPAYIANDLIVRCIAAVGAYYLLRELNVPVAVRHVLAALFAVSIVNTTFGLTIAGLPAVSYLLAWRSGWKRLALILFIGWNTSLYLSGMFFLAAAPYFHRFVFQQPLDRKFVFGWIVYGLGLGLGNAALAWLALTSDMRWHREEWGIFDEFQFPFAWRALVALPLLPLFAIAAVIGLRDSRVRWAVAFGIFIIVWYQLTHLTFVQEQQRALEGPLAHIQLDRFYFLWPYTLIVVVGLAASHAGERPQLFLLAATFVGFLVAATPHQHLRQLARAAVGTGTGYPPFAEYYKFDWFRTSGLNSSTPVLSVGIDPMIAPMNGVPAIDGYFPLYPLAYKHRFREIIRNSLGPSGAQEEYDTWGNKIYTFHPDNQPELLNFCAARRMGAIYVLSSVPIQTDTLELVSSGPLRIYRIVQCGDRAPAS